MVADRQGPAGMRRIDPVLIEVMKHELAAVSEEMAIAISRTGRSPQVRVGDFGAAVCDNHGRFFDSGYTFPLQLVGFDEVMKHVLGKWRGRLDPGDVILLNDPYAGMGHMPDTAIVAPVFWQGEIVAYTIAYSHHTDTGGRYPGGFSSQSSSSYEEGLRLPMVKLIAGGKRNDELIETILANVRTTDDWLGDIDAKLAGCWRGEREFIALLEKYGLQNLRDCFTYFMDASEMAARAVIARVPDGRYEAEAELSDDGFGNEVSLSFKLAMIVEGDRLTLDFTGCPAQLPSAINCPYASTKGMAIGTVKTMVSPEAVMNSGFIRTIEVVAPEGSILNPRYPSAVGGRAPTSLVVSQLVMEAIGKAMPGEVPIMGDPADMLHFAGHDAAGKPFSMMDAFFGGWGARPTKDGIDGVAMVMVGSTGLPPAEATEREFPLVIEGFGFVPDTAGAGRYRGSYAVWRRWRFVGSGHALLRTSRPGASPPGFLGGHAGSRSETALVSDGVVTSLPMQSHRHLTVKPGDVIHHVVGGTAGYGNPRERDPQVVLEEVREGKLTIGAARSQYGVAIDPQGLAVDEVQTALLRSRALPPAAAAS